MSTRKYLRRKVRNIAAIKGWKPSKAVQNWRTILGVYPHFVGKKRQEKGSEQPILKYPFVKGGLNNET